MIEAAYKQAASAGTGHRAQGMTSASAAMDAGRGR